MDELAKAREIAAQPVEDRLDGRRGDEARDVAARLLQAAGLTYLEGTRLLSAFGWSEWVQGYQAGRNQKTED